ncbi:MAG: phosphoribosyltransferase [Chitinophagaceae bacterium]|nr:phosphoribosyltransferase [Chitinophagaceae bacterium]
MSKKYILTEAIAEKKLKRMALEVAERNYTENELLLIGIKENGIVIANIIAKLMKDVFKGKITVVALSMDKKKPEVIAIEKDVALDGKTILLIDDVANSGRTMLYALKPLLEEHPKKIQTLALVERTHKSFPVDVDYVGLSISTTLDEHIYVEVAKGKVLGAWME